MKKAPRKTKRPETTKQLAARLKEILQRNIQEAVTEVCKALDPGYQGPATRVKPTTKKTVLKKSALTAKTPKA